MVSTAVNTMGVFITSAMPLFYVVLAVGIFLFAFKNFTGVIVRGIRKVTK